MSFIFSLIRICLGGKKCDWVGERFWSFILPYIITASSLKKYANNISHEFVILLSIGAINTQKKIDALYEASNIYNKCFLLSLVESFRIARGNDFVYPSFNLIDKDIQELRKMPHAPMFSVYQDPEDRLANSFSW